MPVQILCVPDGGWGDIATGKGRVYNKKYVVEYAKALGFTVVELDKANAIRAPFEGALGATEPTRAVYGTGHGNDTVYTGYREAVLLEPSNYPIVRNRSISLISCVFGKAMDALLGHGMVHGRLYTDTAYFNASGGENDEDPLSDMYFKCFHAGDRAELEGKTYGEADTLQVKAYNDTINAADPLNKYYLQWDLDCLLFKGDFNGRLTQPTVQNRVSIETISSDGTLTPQGDMISTDGQNYTATVNFPKPGRFKFIYHAARADGGKASAWTDWFNIMQPSSEIVITLITPQGGEEIPTGDVPAKVRVSWGK